MKTRAAVLHDVGQEWQIENVTLDEPGPGEVLVKTAVAGMCHSDEHILQGDLGVKNEDADAFGMDRMFPLLGGHEGAGVVQAVGPGSFLEVGGLEATARVLFVHPNTVRYRIGRIAELTGYDLAHPRDGYAVRLALALAAVR